MLFSRCSFRWVVFGFRVLSNPSVESIRFSVIDVLVKNVISLSDSRSRTALVIVYVYVADEMLAKKIEDPVAGLTNL